METKALGVWHSIHVVYSWLLFFITFVSTYKSGNTGLLGPMVRKRFTNE
jgi:hypothetical protein